MANKVSGEDADRHSDNRSFRYKLLDTARKLSSGRTRECLYHLNRPDQETVLIARGQSGHYGISGVKTCGSVWGCPVCAPKIAIQRAREVTEAALNASNSGRSVWMAALTIPHSRFQSCKELREALSLAFKKVQQGRAWVGMKAGYELEGMIRSVEVTHGKNGWHPHIHVLFFLPEDIQAETAETFGRAFYQRWIEIVDGLGYGKPTWEVWEFERCRKPKDAAGYVAKWSMELTMGQQKRAKGGNRTPWQLLEDARNGDDMAALLFRRYAEDFKGARQLTWSQGLKKKYVTGEDRTDEEIADEDLPVVDERPIQIYRPAWVQITYRGLVGNVIQAAEAGGREVVDMFLSAMGIANTPDFVSLPSKVPIGRPRDYDEAMRRAEYRRDRANKMERV